jgi:hypothetical protein
MPGCAALAEPAKAQCSFSFLKERKKKHSGCAELHGTETERLRIAEGGRKSPLQIPGSILSVWAQVLLRLLFYFMHH